MGYKHVDFNQTKMVHNKGSAITGSNDAIFIRNKYQLELDNANAAIVNQVHYIEQRSNEAKELFNKAQGFKRGIDAHIQERGSLYETLGNLLNKETKFEFDMWRTTQQNKKITQVNIKQKFSDSDVDEMRFDSMLEYLKQYPTYASKSSFKDILDKIKGKEYEIRKEKEYYIKAVSDYNYQLSTFEKELVKGGDKFIVYDKILKEGTEKLANTRYRNSLFYKLASEKNKDECNIVTLSHRVEQFRNTLDLIKNEYAQYKSKNLTEMEY